MKPELIVTIYAAIVATGALIWNIINATQKQKPKFIVKVGYKIVRSTERSGYFFESVKIRVINVKSIPRCLKINGFEYVEKRGKEIIPDKTIGINSVFSPILNNSEEYVYNLDNDKLAWIHPDIIEKFRIVVIDNAGKVYRSKFQRINHTIIDNQVDVMDASHKLID